MKERRQRNHQPTSPFGQERVNERKINRITGTIGLGSGGSDKDEGCEWRNRFGYGGGGGGGGVGGD